ncbi:NADH-quinone oxidoreductase subunit L [bacterium]|nr:NADH-quinone oxidoreductase subunit L [bacterium]
MNPLLYPIAVPILLGLICLIIPRRAKFVHEIIALIGSAMTFGLLIWIFTLKPFEFLMDGSIILRVDQLSGFILLASGLFGFLITLYSFKFMKEANRSTVYYGSILWTLGAACGALMANHLVVLLVFWGFLGITLYLLILTGGNLAADAAKKTLIIIGGSDALMLLSIAFIYSVTSSFDISTMQLSAGNPLIILAFILLAVGAFAKAGAMPMHTWIPDVAETAPIPVTAYLPAALDKLLGIYLLGRMCLYMFEMSRLMNLFLMIVGSVTIIAAVMMALIQHDMRRLLAYHAVSQVGYMILGMGTGSPVGIAGGIFHMLNHSIYKSCLFLSGGSVQHRTGTTDLDRLGGLGRMMPITFSSFLIAAFAISGIPPFNGFVSKWMIYQGLVELGQVGDKLWIIWLVAAMFGSGLTLASFMKLTHSVFLGVPSQSVESKKIKEVGIGMTVPMVVLALLCVIFGIFAYSVPLKNFILPAVGNVSYLGIWDPGLATVMILVGLVVGLFIYYLMGNVKIGREANSFIGGEHLPTETRVTGTGFYNTIREFGLFRYLYRWAEAKWFDIYDQLYQLAMNVGRFFGKAHVGIFTVYMVWVLVGLTLLFVFLMGRW